MFSFHKPKIYRSISGCCICKAKSSSSRFTDSKKYEAEFEKCFRVQEKRSGEICNACVLLVKRWKKLPAGTQRDWRHVVDARAGPGNKLSSSSSCKSSSGKSSLAKKLSKPKKLIMDDILGDDSMTDVILRRRPLTPDRSDSSDDENMDDDYYLSDPEESFDQRTGRENNLGNNKSSMKDRDRNKTPHQRPKSFAVVKKRSCPEDDAFEGTSLDARVCSFLDMSFWRREKICCGVIFKGPNNEVVISPKLLKPCSCRKTPSSGLSPKTPSGSTSDNISLVSSFSPVSSSRLDNEDNESNASSYNSSVP